MCDARIVDLCTGLEAVGASDLAVAQGARKEYHKRDLTKRYLQEMRTSGISVIAWSAKLIDEVAFLEAENALDSEVYLLALGDLAGVLPGHILNTLPSVKAHYAAPRVGREEPRLEELVRKAW